VGGVGDANEPEALLTLPKVRDSLITERFEAGGIDSMPVAVVADSSVAGRQSGKFALAGLLFSFDCRPNQSPPAHSGYPGTEEAFKGRMAAVTA